LTVDRFAFHQERAGQDPQAGGVRNLDARVVTGDETIESLTELQAFEEGVDEGEGAEAFTAVLRVGQVGWVCLTNMHLAYNIKPVMGSRQPSKPTGSKPNRARLRTRTSALRKELGRLDFVVTGTLHHRTKVCGKPNCKCASDPNARHGPYYEWGRMRAGKLVQTTVTPAQAKLLERAIANHKRAKELLAEWERLSETEILKPESVRDA